MKFSSKKIDCLKYSESSMRKHPFTVIEYIFNYQDEEDKTFLDNCIDDAKELSNAVNPKSANLSTYSRYCHVRTERDAGLAGRGAIHSCLLCNTHNAPNYACAKYSTT